MRHSLPIAASYRKPIFEAIALQVILGLLSALVLDGGDCRHICGAALVAFWGGAAVLVWRHPRDPTKTDLQLVRFGFLPVLVIAFAIIHAVWRAKGL